MGLTHRSTISPFSFSIVVDGLGGFFLRDLLLSVLSE